MDIQRVLKSYSKLSDEEVLDQMKQLDLNIVLQNNKLKEDTLKKIISFADLRTLIKNQEYSPEFANETIMSHINTFDHQNSISMNEIMDYQKKNWIGVSIDKTTQTFVYADKPVQSDI